tara:strand:+ start:13 stop:471 length:459 start_codon:yes stop_codon:yes gene_type:complete
VKKFLIIFLFCSLPLKANDFDFQQVYEVPEKSSEDIETAFGELKFNVEVSKLDKFSAALDLISGDKTEKKNVGKIVCDISPKLLPRVNENFDGDIILETKDSRYRLTITNMISQDGFALSKMAKHAQKACKKDLKKWADAKFEQVKSFNSDW